MTKNQSKKPYSFERYNWKVGLVSFTDPRSEVQFVTEREEYLKNCHDELVQKLEEQGFRVVDPQSNLQREDNLWGINNVKQLEAISLEFFKENISALICGCWSWTEPHLPLKMARKLDVPTCLITKNTSAWPGVTSIVSTGASFWESSSSFFIKNHARFLLKKNAKSPQFGKLSAWLRAACSLKQLQTGTLLFWGAGPALNMEHLDEDIPFLKRFLIGDVETIDQFELIRTAETILSKDKQRVIAFQKWLIENGCRIIFDEAILTEESLAREIALYLASKDLVNKRYQNGIKVIGASIKCQPELSVQYGVTPCLTPSFLPYPTDHEGDKLMIPTVCEGDIKGLISSVLLHGLNPKISPLFGDVKMLEENYFVIANCGGGNAFYASNSFNPKLTLSNSFIRPQCQGETGGAFGFITPETETEVTFTRLIRIDNNYFLQAGLGKIVKLDKKLEDVWGGNWPHTAVELKISKELFIKTIGANHVSLTLGNFIKELEYFCDLLGVPLIRLDQTKSAQSFLDSL
ncbi:MAG: fucose isomerase [Candidatus Heimdallarchaeota archaeon]|nr:fucose isomerase [Candidatus Heimdallarchaeota archaeon]